MNTQVNDLIGLSFGFNGMARDEIKIKSAHRSQTATVIPHIEVKYLLLEAESAIFVRVEEANKAECLRLADAEVALVTEVVKDLKGADKGVAVPVKSLEGGMGSEIADGAKTLARSFKASLAITDCNEQLL